MIWMPYGDDVPFILYGMVWASMIHDFMEGILGDPVFFLPLEGNIIVAQNKQLLYTFHKWRERDIMGWTIWSIKSSNAAHLLCRSLRWKIYFMSYHFGGWLILY